MLLGIPCMYDKYANAYKDYLFRKAVIQYVTQERKKVKFYASETVGYDFLEI